MTKPNALYEANLELANLRLRNDELDRALRDIRVLAENARLHATDAGIYPPKLPVDKDVTGGIWFK